MAKQTDTLTAVDAGAARDELARLVQSRQFRQADRQRRFLEFLVTETLAGHSDRLKGYTIGVEVFDREPGFDPALDAIVRVEAVRLRAKLSEYYQSEGSADPVRFEIPKGSYTIQIARHQPASNESEAGGTTSGAVSPIKDKPALAVLPFNNMSSDREQDYFADGITDNLITELSRLSGLLVISRHSSFVYKDVSRRADEIGRELGVAYLVEGSVQRSAHRVRVTAQLVDTGSGAHLWAEHYDRELADIFAIQDEVTRRIVAIRLKLTGPELERLGRGGTTSLEAHDYLLRGLTRFWVYTPESSEEAQALFSQALELDPGYATAHAWLARTLAFRWTQLWDPADETLDRAYEHARAAVSLDEDLPFALSVLGWVHLWRKEPEAAIAAGWRAVAIDPNNADAHHFLSLSLSAVGRGEEALHYTETAMRLNPFPSAFYMFAHGMALFVLEQYDKAIAAFNQGIELTEVFAPNHWFLCLIYTLLGREEEARFERERLLALTGGRRPVVQRIMIDEELRLRTEDLEKLAGLAGEP